MATVLPYSKGQLQIGLNLLRAKKAGRLGPVESQHRFGLRDRPSRHDGFIAIQSGDTDQSGDFDPSEEMREHMRRLAKRKAALRNAEDEGYSSQSSSSSSCKRARPGSDTGQLLVKFDFSFPGGKWFLRGFCDEEQSMFSLAAASGLAGMVNTSPSCGTTESSKAPGSGAREKHPVSDETQEGGSSAKKPSNQEYLATEEGSIDAPPPVPNSMVPLLTDPRIIEILDIPQPSCQPSYVVAAASSSSPGQEKTPRTALNSYTTETETQQRSKGGYYDIIPNIVSIRPKNKRRPWSVRR